MEKYCEDLLWKSIVEYCEVLWSIVEYCRESIVKY